MVLGVRYSRGFKFSVILLLLITLGLKLAARSAIPPALTEKQIQLRVADFLVRQHFAVTVAEVAEEGKPSVSATSAWCRMVVIQSPALGYQEDALRRYATADDQVFVVFAGKVYREQPTWLTVSDALWARFRRELGFNAQASPVLGVVAGRNCQADRLPWRDLATNQAALPVSPGYTTGRPRGPVTIIRKNPNETFALDVLVG